MGLRWPWVSRLAFDTLKAERDRLAVQNDSLVDNLTRLQRREFGLPETPRPEREPLDAMPGELMRYIAGAGSAYLRGEMERTAWKERAAGMPWEQIVAEVIGPTPNGEEPA